MTLHQLKVFSSVARFLNVTKASAELHISQPSVSHQLKLLGEECRVKLYKKNSRGIELTEDGRAFLNDAEPILLRVEKLKRIFSFNPCESEATFLTVGGSQGPCASFLPGLAVIFRKTHPNARLILRTDNSLVMEQLVQNSDVEVAVVTNPSASPWLIYEPCRREEAVFFASSRHPLARRPWLSLAKLAQVPLVVFKKGKIGGVANILKQVEARGFHLTIVMHCETAEAVKAAVKTGMGLGILYRDLAEPDIQRGDLRVIHVPGLKMHIDSFIIYHKEKPLSANAKDFLGLVREQTRRNRWVGGSPQGRQTLFPSSSSRSPASPPGQAAQRGREPSGNGG